jgi:hypothetical protein
MHLLGALPASKTPGKIRRHGRSLGAAFGAVALLAGAILGLNALPS